MPGSTFSAEQAHGPLLVGQVLDNGYALVKRTPAETGDVLTFKPHQPLEQDDRSVRCYGRPQRHYRTVETA
jgi:hypothetical protein